MFDTWKYNIIHLYQIWYFSIACSNGKFGINCTHTCSAFCKENTSCNYITGECDEGCQEGWSGPLCGKGG